MNRESMKYWLSTSALGACLIATTPPPSAQPQEPAALKRVNEVTLAGLRPGRETLAAAEKRYKAKYREAKLGREEANVKEWWDACNGKALRLEVDAKGVIRSVTVTSLALRVEECSEKAAQIAHHKFWFTGRGLKLGDPRDRVIDLYGEPSSSGPSVKGDRELELLSYAFDWAGSDVPQLLEVSCDRATGRVVEITLAFPNL